MEVCTLDFETRSEADLPKVGSYLYATHPSTEVLCLSYCFGDGPIRIWRSGLPWTHPWRQADPDPEDLFDWVRQGLRLEAHNAGFERDVWEFVCHGRMGWPAVSPSQWSCSAAKAAASSFPRALEKAGQAIRANVQKDKEGHRLMLKLSKPRRPTKADPHSRWHESPEEHARNWAYCRTDVASERALSDLLPPLTDFERAVWLVDQRINRRGVAVDLEYATSAVAMSDAAKAMMNDELAQITRIDNLRATQRAQVKEWLDGRGLSLPDTSGDTMQAVLDDPRGEDEDVLRVLFLMIEANKTSVAKYQKTLEMTSPDGRCRGLFLYCGADRTGRWSGKAIQPHNLPRASMHKDPELVAWAMRSRDPELVRMLFGLEPMDFLSKAVRGVIVAAQGKELNVADYAQIESRVLFWLVGDDEMLTLFRTGGKVYEVMAAEIYDKAVEEVTDDERQMGKQSILGLGYQMGWAKFIVTVAKYGIVIDEDFARHVVNTYRTKRRRVVEGWYELEDAAVAALLTPERWFPALSGAVSYRKRGRHLVCRLPSGRELRYVDAFLADKPTPWGETRKAVHYYGTNERGQWVPTDTYGGKLMENIVQAVARDLLAHAMVEAERQGWDTVLHVHDELGAEMDAGQTTAQELEELMCDIPTWASGCPVAAEGWVGDRYRK